MANLSTRMSALVSTQWLTEQITNKAANLRLLDGSWHMPYTRRKARQEFYQKHIQEAQFFDIDECCDKTTELPHMLPSAEQFETYVGKLGINNDTHVVVYDNNETIGLFSAQRVWWTFRAFGHNTISILDGGMPKWIGDGYDTTDEVDFVEPQTFKANFLPNFVKSFDEMQSNLETKDFTVIDARPAGRFEGTSPEPRVGIKPGHMPGSVNIPFTTLTDPDTKTFKSEEELKELFTQHGVDLDKPLVASCGSGVSACQLALAAYVCGKEDVPVYDGSWTEWYLKANHKQVVTSG